MKVKIVTKPGMISETDWHPLSLKASVDYYETDHVSARELASLCDDYDCLMLNFDVAEPFDVSFYDLVASKKLRLISCDITGMSWAFPSVARAHNIVLCNTPNYCTESVAEHIFAQMLLLSRRIHETYVDFSEGKTPEIRKGFDLKGKTIGIIGLGHIGTRVAEIATGFNMKVLTWNHRPKASVYNQVDLDTLLTTSDVIVICLKTTDSTLGFLDNEKLKKCKSNAIIINQAGEQLINKDHVYDGIIHNTIAGYAGTLNNDETHELYKHRSVVALPANAWYSDDSLENLRRIWVENVIRFIEGDCINVVSAD